MNFKIKQAKKIFLTFNILQLKNSVIFLQTRVIPFFDAILTE